MFECRACTLRCLRAIAGDALSIRQPLRRSTPRPLPLPPRRAASTATAAPNALQEGGNDFLTTPVPTPRSKALSGSDEQALKIELRYLRDPLKLSEHVKYTLRCDKPDKALDLCRLASKEMSCVVSWNAVVDWHMRRFKVNEAIKIYNEMKKRAQFPDSYTHVLLLRGLGLRSHVGQPVREENVSKAVSIYNSMSSPTARVRPSIMHTNAALNVCALALDMDALWGIAEKIPEGGPGSADHITYTIIINAIRYSAFGDNHGTLLHQIAARRQKAVNEGRRVWLDVIRKWRAGELRIDQDLVNAMGRLLLTSKRLRDWDNVLDLVRQTTNIDRLVASVDDPARRTEHVPQPDEPANPKLETDDQGFSASPAATAYKPVTALPSEHLSSSKNPPSLVYVQPSAQILSLLIDTCQQMRTPQAATAYWDLFTNPPYNVTPDLANFDALLRLYALNRASARAAKLLSQDLPASGIVPKNSTFRTAMHVCQRDMRSPRALEHATAVIDAMEANSTDPDHQTLIEYLSLALTTNDGEKIARAIDRMDSIVHNLRSRISYGAEVPKSPERDLRDIKGASGFLRALVGTIDSLLHRGLIPEDEQKRWQARRSDLTHFLGRVDLNVDVRERKLGRQREAQGKDWGGLILGKKEGLRMSKAQWEVKKFKWNERERGERRRERADRVNMPIHGGEKRLGAFGLGGS